ncbi:MFS transporter [Metarhizium rileyi]|uniref:MFS transporter n=1 Tax=Metarhizium rileyi (strain RCEF 4871) TaxID=1649241 RepID=A0A167E497_METRR|nr:MFS transporter [Metarhizium rileyi RCEF 4871]
MSAAPPESLTKEVEAQTAASSDAGSITDRNGYLVDAHFASGHVKTTPDGSTVLIPQPSDDPNDPLNWTWARKHVFLFIIAATSLLPDYGSATGAVTLLPQAEIWHIDPDVVNHSQVGNVFMIGAGGLVAICLGAYFGRLPVMFWFMVLALATAIWCTAAETFESFMAARILNGFFSPVAEAGGLMFIRDMFFFHEHARKINIWASFIILSPYFGPLFSAFIIDTQKWQWAFGLYTIMTGICVAAIFFIMDETYYDRKLAPSEQPQRKSRVMRVIGTEQWHTRHLRNTFTEAVSRPFIVLFKLPVLISNTYYLLAFAWVVGINTTLAIFLTPLYEFGPKRIGFFYFTPIVAAILGERRNNGRLEPEARLAVVWIATPFLCSGLILLGFSLERAYHYMLAALGWGLYVFGIMITTVGVNAYNLDSYPTASGEVAGWLNLSRVAGGFIISYFQVRWAEDMGAIKSFGIQAAICFGAFFLIVLLQVYGKTLRKWSGQPNFKTI